MVSQNLNRLKARISSVCARVNRDPDSITIVAVSKNRPSEQINQAIEAGITDIGENRIQETKTKYDKLQTPDSKLRTIKWHMVGHLQTNKVKEAVRIFDLIHSVDSLRLASEIDKQAARIQKIQDVLIEVKTSAEESKFGLKPDETIEVIKGISGLKNVNIKGLMTIAPMAGSPEQVRPYFKALRELREKICGLRVADCQLRILSMGMTDDFEVAIEEGATMVRIGRAIFGDNSVPGDEGRL